MQLTVHGVDEIRELLSRRLGPTHEQEITQEAIDAFARLTGDHGWIHVDVERARRESPYGATIAHGDLVLALLGGLRCEFIDPVGFALAVNRGWRDVTFERPVLAGSAISATSVAIALDELEGGVWELVERFEVLSDRQRVCSALGITWLMEEL